MMDEYDDYCRRVQQERERLKAEVDLLHHNAMQCDHENTDAIIESLRQERAELRAEVERLKARLRTTDISR